MGAALADLGLLQPRPAAHAHAPGRLGGPRARCRDAAAHPARHAVPLRRRGARARGRATCRPSASSTRAGATAAARRSRGRRPTAMAGRPSRGCRGRPSPPRAASRPQRADAGSILHLRRAILALRRDVARAAPRHARRRSTMRPTACSPTSAPRAATAGACGSTSRARGVAAGGVGRRAGDGRHRRWPPGGRAQRSCGRTRRRTSVLPPQEGVGPTFGASGAAQRLGRRGVGREERLDRELGRP